MSAKISTLAPIVLFAYNRANELKQTIEALQANYLANESEIHVFSDGPRKLDDIPKVEKVRRIINNMSGFKQVHRYYAECNHGLAESVITGVSQVLLKYSNVIVLEDDLQTSPNFLDYMNHSLNQYESNTMVFSIAGYTFPIKRPHDYPFDVYLFPRTGSWGWATWADRWKKADWDVVDYKMFMSTPEHRKAFNQGGADLASMLQRQQNGEINSWAIRWCYSQYKFGGLTLYPTISKVQNIGFSDEATHTKVFNRYQTILDKGLEREFNLPLDPILKNYYLKQVQKQFSFKIRLINRLKTYIGVRSKSNYFLNTTR
ncbi:glycosyltransferase [Nibrella saemangeumensis]